MKYRSRIELVGEVVSGPEYSHAAHGREFWKMQVAATRQSGVRDILPVTLPAEVLETWQPEKGEALYILGQIRSHAESYDGVNRLCVEVAAAELRAPEPGDPENAAEIWGVLDFDPKYRLTPFGREIADMLVRVPGKYQKVNKIPCIAWGRNAQLAAALDAGQQIMLRGRLQSRKYTKEGADGQRHERTVYEVSAAEITAPEPEEAE